MTIINSSQVFFVRYHHCLIKQCGATIYPSLVFVESSTLFESSTLSEFESHDFLIEEIMQVKLSSIETSAL